MVVSWKKTEVSREIEELSEEKERLGREVTGGTEELDCLKAEMSELQAKGFTSETLRKIKKIEGKSGSELLSQVDTAEKCQRKLILKGKIRALEMKKERSRARKTYCTTSKSVAGQNLYSFLPCT